METTTSFSFRARYAVVEDEQYDSLSLGSAKPNPWIVSAGRWDSHEQAAKAAADWLSNQAKLSPSMFEVGVITVEELELDNVSS
jgi:hypothetical protein